MSIVSLKSAKNAEAERRLRLLGDLSDQPYDYNRLRDRARQVRVSPPIFVVWWRAYQSQGKSGLVPDWPDEIDVEEHEMLLDRRTKLGDIADGEVVSPKEIQKIADAMGRTYERAEKWLQRYRNGGLWALAPQNNPEHPIRPKQQRSDLGVLDENALQEVFDRREKLGELADKLHVSAKKVKQRAQEVGVSPSTLWGYLRDYRKYGLAGLAPRVRSDKGESHGITPQMREIVMGIRLSNKDYSAKAVHKESCKRASALGEAAPTLWQVRQICKEIPSPVKERADGRHDKFRSRSRLTYPLRADGIIYQIDHTPVDVLTKDLRNKPYRNASEEARLWLTLLIDYRSRLVLGAHFGYEHPDRVAVAHVIHDALVVSDEHPYGGIPNEIWIDNGKELNAYYIQQLVREMGIILHTCAPHQPQLKGIVERFFGTLNTRLWSTLPGYVSSNTVERNPTAKAKLTAAELVDRFWKFADEYHHEIHSETEQTPIECWQQHCFAEPADLRKLDVLLLEPDSRKVTKQGIEYKNRIYWHAALATLVHADVLVRSVPSPFAPDEIEVYHDGHWMCTAFAIDSDRGMSIAPDQIRSAQRDQRDYIRKKIDGARTSLKLIDQEIAKLSQPKTAKAGAHQKSTKQKVRPNLDVLGQLAANKKSKTEGGKNESAESRDASTDDDDRSAAMPMPV